MSRVLAPLHNFSWNGQTYDLGGSVHIEPIIDPFDFSPWDDFLSSYDKQTEMGFHTHFISLPVGGAFGQSYMDVIHLFLFCLWVVHYTRTNVRYVLVPPIGHQTALHRVCGYHRSARERSRSRIYTSDLQQIRSLLPISASIYGKKHRLATALFFTHIMKTQDRWATALLAGANAIEALFSKNTKGGQTFPVSRRMGAFLENAKSRQVSIGRRMLRLYNRRSELVHGRYTLNIGDEKQAKTQLGYVFQIENLLRRCWGKILTDETIRGKFQKSKHRDDYLTRLAAHISKHDLGF